MLRRFFNTKPATLNSPKINSLKIFKLPHASLLNNKFLFKNKAILNPLKPSLLISNDYSIFASCKRFIAANDFNLDVLNSLLVDAIKSENLEMMRRFLRKGADPNLIEMPHPDFFLTKTKLPAMTPLLYLCHQLYGRQETSAESENLRHMIFDIIRASSSNTLNKEQNNRDHLSRMPLHLASIYCDEGIILALLKKGADPNITVGHRGMISNSCDVYLKNTDKVNQELVDEYEKCMIKCKEEELSKQGTVKQNSEQAETRVSKKA